MPSREGPLASKLVGQQGWVKYGNVEWRPIGLKLRNDTDLGVSRDGYWAVAAGSNVREVREISDLVALFVCLEMRPDEFQSELEVRTRAAGIPVAVARAFPIRELAEAALCSRSAYWAELAVAWVQELQEDDLPVGALEALSNAQWAPQKLRQRARALRNRRKSSQS